MAAWAKMLEVPVVVAVHLSPRDLTPNRAKLRRLLAQRAVEQVREDTPLLRREDLHGVLVDARPEGPASLDAPQVVVGDDGSGLAHVPLLAQGVFVRVGDTYRMRVFGADAPDEGAVVGLLQPAEDVLAGVPCVVSAIHRPPRGSPAAGRVAAGDVVPVRVLDVAVSSWMGDRPLVTATMLGL